MWSINSENPMNGFGEKMRSASSSGGTEQQLSSPRRASLPRANYDPFLSHLQRSSACIGLSIALCCPQRYPGPWFPAWGAGAGRAPSRPKAGADPHPRLTSARARRRPSIRLKLCIPWVVAEATQSLANAGCKPAGGGLCGVAPSEAAR